MRGLAGSGAAKLQIFPKVGINLRKMKKKCKGKKSVDWRVFIASIHCHSGSCRQPFGKPMAASTEKVLHRIEKVVEKTSFYIATSKKVVSLRCQIVVRGREQFAFAAIFKLDHSDSHIRT
ncbi:MAG: hypothetical protein IK004_08245 [Bacteroidales bacterium]|nr:hypothetical protein [Bacteroidales bacterium]